MRVHSASLEVEGTPIGFCPDYCVFMYKFSLDIDSDIYTEIYIAKAGQNQRVTLRNDMPAKKVPLIFRLLKEFAILGYAISEQYGPLYYRASAGLCSVIYEMLDKEPDGDELIVLYAVLRALVLYDPIVRKVLANSPNMREDWDDTIACIKQKLRIVERLLEYYPRAEYELYKNEFSLISDMLDLFTKGSADFY